MFPPGKCELLSTSEAVRKNMKPWSDGSRVRISQAADDKVVSWRERRFHAYEVFSRTERNSDARSHQSVPLENILHPTAGDPELTGTWREPQQI